MIGHSNITDEVIMFQLYTDTSVKFIPDYFIDKSMESKYSTSNSKQLMHLG